MTSLGSRDVFMDVFLWILLSWGARWFDVGADALILSACEGDDESAVSWEAALYLFAIYNRGPLENSSSALQSTFCLSPTDGGHFLGYCCQLRDDTLWPLCSPAWTVCSADKAESSSALFWVLSLSPFSTYTS